MQFLQVVPYFDVFAIQNYRKLFQLNWSCTIVTGCGINDKEVRRVDLTKADALWCCVVLCEESCFLEFVSSLEPLSIFHRISKIRKIILCLLELSHKVIKVWDLFIAHVAQ